MKRFLIIAAAAVGLLAVAAAQAQQNCLWNEAGECWPVTGDAVDNCKSNAWLFEGGAQGVTTFCVGGTFVQGRNNNPPTSAVAAKGCCRWSTEAPKCFNVYTDADVTNCSGGTNVYWYGECVTMADDGESFICPSGIPTYNGSNSKPENWVTCTGAYFGYCKWVSGCFRISACTGGDPGSDCAYTNSTCSEAFATCLAYSPTSTVYSDEACTTPKQSGGGDGGISCGDYCDWGSSGCAEIKSGGASNEYTTCEDANANCDKNGARYSTPTCTEHKVGGAGETSCDGFCRWKISDCVKLKTNANNLPEPITDCDAARAHCQIYGQLFSDDRCAEPVSVRLVAGKAAVSGLRVSYAKNRVIVNWTPATKVSSGTVQLINMKGAALSTAFIKANSGKVSVRLGTVGVPAGMYFVHINAVGQNGKKIVAQSAIGVVK